MKKLFILILSFSMLFGCESKNAEIEIIPNYDEIYIPIISLNKSAKIEKGLTEFSSPEFKISIQNISKENNNQIPSIIKYNLYINEKGGVDKIKTINTTNFGNLNLLMMDKFSKVQFTEIQKDGKLIKYQTLWEYDIEHFAPVPDSIKLDKVQELDEYPSPIGRIPVEYPENAKKNGIEGKVLVKVTIDEKGNVVKTEVVKGVDADLNKAAVDAIEKTKFKPAKVKGKPVKTEIMIPIMFKLA